MFAHCTMALYAEFLVESTLLKLCGVWCLTLNQIDDENEFVLDPVVLSLQDKT